MHTFQNDFVPNQHGFLLSRSTLTKYICSNKKATETINNKIQEDIIITDCTKAFNMVDNISLVNKLSEYNFSGSACNFIVLCVSTRWQQGKIDKSVSEGYVA